MFDDPTIVKLIQIWPDLPRLSGAQWPRVYWQLDDLLRRYRKCEADDARAHCAIQIRQIVLANKALRTAWNAVSDRLASRGRMLLGGDERPQRAAGSRNLKHMLGADLISDLDFDSVELNGESFDLREALGGSQHVVRWTDVLAPSRVQVGQRFPVIVGLTQKQTAAAGKRLVARPDQRVRIVVKSSSLENLGDRAKEIVVQADKDSDPAVFYFQASESGSHDLLIDFWLEGALVASQSAAIVAVTEATTDAATARAGTSLALDRSGIPFPDLLLRVTTAGNQLRYDLNFANTRFVQIDGPKLQTDPREFRVNLLREIEGLAKQPGASPDYLTRQLEKIGQRLYRELFPPEFLREYRQFSGDVHTLHIVSDEPYIPWELVKPYDDDAGSSALNHDFWCAQFELARWVCPSAAAVPADRIHVSSAICVAPSDSGLSEAQQERADLEAWCQATKVTMTTPTPATLAAVEGLLCGAQPIQLWHFACHGDLAPAAPNKSPLKLANNTQLYPDDLVGPAQTRLKTDRPFVFLNACRVGSGGMTLTGLGGWASVLIEHCGIGALIAPQWSVNDRLAREFARAVYEQFRTVAGCTVAHAVRTARETIRKAAPDNPTWLAYSLYAHPNAHVSVNK